jgi:hypothetical protein
MSISSNPRAFRLVRFLKKMSSNSISAVSYTIKKEKTSICIVPTQLIILV